MSKSDQSSPSQNGQQNKQNEHVEKATTSSTKSGLQSCQDDNSVESSEAPSRCKLDEKRGSLCLDQVISDGVESAVMNVIEQSVQCMFEETDEPTVDLVATLSNTVEESVQGLINEYNVDNEARVDTWLNHSAGGYASRAGFFDGTHLDEDKSSVSSDKIEMTENKKLDKWKEAGQALRKALCQLGDSSYSDENISNNFPSSTQNVNSVCLQNCAEVKESDGDVHVKSVINTDTGSCEKDNAEMRLAKSMEQSFIWSHEHDAMNEMWAEYEGHIACTCHKSPSSSEDDNPSVGNLCRCSDNTNPGTSPAVSSDLSLAELRQRMRTLVSALPIAANQMSRALGGSVNSEIAVHSGTLSASELNTHRSPRTTRKRHRKSGKIPVVLSEDENETCVRRYPPKLCRVKVKHNHKNAACTKCHEKSLNIPLQHQCVPDSAAKLVIEADKVSSSDKYARDQLGNNIKCAQEGEKSPESESWCTDIDKEVESSGMKQTESVANFADVESCESEREKQMVVQEYFPCVHSATGKCNGHGDNTCNKELIEETNSISSLDIDSLDTYSDELEYFELPDFSILFDSISDDDLDLTLSYNDMKSLQAISITDSSSDAEAGVEADDEFECDCLLCQCPRDFSHQNTQDTRLREDGEINSRYSDDISELLLSLGSDADDEEAGADDSSVSSANPLGLRLSDGYSRDVLDLMLTNVIMHMLSVYPDLLNDQTPPPVPDCVFKSFTVIKVTQCFIDSESSCPICLCKFELGEEMKELPCAHLFHPLCIQAWVQKAGTCPVCRRNLVHPVREADA